MNKFYKNMKRRISIYLQARFIKNAFLDLRNKFLHSGKPDASKSLKNTIYDIYQAKVYKTKNNKLKSDKFRVGLLLSLLLFCGLSTLLIKENAIHSQNLQTGIANEIIRFHVIANSDSEDDQALKLTVKDTLVKNMAPLLKNADTVTEARTVLSDKLSYIQELAEATVKDNGYGYPVTVSLEQCYFPLKIYGDYTFPPGTYEALRVQIGEAEGKNWWCVMFPPLCFVDETYSIVDKDSDKKLKYLLTEEEYNTIKSEKTPVKVKFKLFEMLKKLFS